MLYCAGGVFTSADCLNLDPNNIDHTLLGTGYGHDAASGLDYYRAKNSFGVSWGEKVRCGHGGLPICVKLSSQGYVRFAKGPQYGSAGMCNIQIWNSFPTKDE